MLRREFLQLAKVFDSKKHGIAGWLVSEKLDGQRCFWDGGCTRGLLATQVPWANTEKDDRLTVAPVSTGLWSRYGKVIRAPDWWLDTLPKMLLDGELYMGRGKFQALESCVRKHTPVDAEWQHVKYHVFDALCPELVFQEGEIKIPNYKKIIRPYEVDNSIIRPPTMGNAGVYHWLLSQSLGSNVQVVEQKELPFSQQQAMECLDEMLLSVTDLGGEGLMLKNRSYVWTPKRHDGLLKVKPYLDSEATIVGFVWGDGKYRGMVGALVVAWNGKVFELGTGLTDADRGVEVSEATIPKTPIMVSKPHRFAIGDTVNFRYRELTDGGTPKEARYKRKV